MLLYAISHDPQRLELFLRAKVPYVQVRVKDHSLNSWKSTLQEWVRCYPDSKLIINDDPEVADAIGAWAVHLGQEDLDRFQPHEFKSLRLGISTHSDEEIERALRFNPAYLGFGPVFPTETKSLNYEPQGVSLLKQQVTQQSLPIVGIGGITPENLSELCSPLPHAVAMISALNAYHTIEDLEQLQRHSFS